MGRLSALIQKWSQSKYWNGTAQDEIDDDWILISQNGTEIDRNDVLRQKLEPKWKKIAREKTEADLAKIPEKWRLPQSVIDEAKSQRSIANGFIQDQLNKLDDEALEITNRDTPELIRLIGNGSLSSVDVVTAFCKRASYAHQLNHNMLEICFDPAIEQARDLDVYFEKHKKPKGPLHGLPVTLKDQFHIEGLETSMGYIGWLGTFEGQKGTGKEKTFESVLVQVLKDLGAVPIGKTSLVMSLWAPETNNNMLGYLVNPHNRNLSAGGSSGGEGAIQALRGSAFGIGTDIGGSVSMPASFNGVFGLKPSSGRIPFEGVANSGLGQQVMPTVAGIIGPSVETLRLVFESILSAKPWLRDPYVLPLSWNVKEENRITQTTKLNLGYMEHDYIVAPHPPIRRALRMVKAALEDQGHKVISWKQPDNRKAMIIHTALARGDGCSDVQAALELSGEPPVPEILHLFPNDGKTPPPITLIEHEKYCVQMAEYRAEYLAYWKSTSSLTEDGNPVDAVILPVTPYAAIRPESDYYYSAYNCFMNVLDYPSVTIPVTFADKAVDVKDWESKPLSEEDKKNRELYDPEVWDGAPAGVQILGPRLGEESLLAIAQVVSEALYEYRRKGAIIPAFSGK